MAHNPIDAAKIILQKTWDAALPVDPEALSKRMKVVAKTKPGVQPTKHQITYRQAHKVKANSPCCVTYFDHKTDSYICEWNPTESLENRRLAFAISMGHLVLGHITKDSLPKEISGFLSNDDTPEDAAAQAFGLELMMPGAFVEDQFGVTREPRELAPLFGVSLAGINLRLSQLGLV
ncbi:Zn-dependent peptidase ImmA (M78 family) [Pseudomonas nitritireducens]|uniref:Zn-dependent peptidase ImmA (M78 family) n=1 Tax=Pseudomonas nitroreducens TaxID=46680 RepID=A0A7W7KEV0_PSENT|nr:ImmA/IrrE family metallo-endopeptidase [Pseudomonas nitritireducens]MBB4861557.1 Zn-dependent peptidase ImmA (M78 family) [Pseudomonas nitritireducens]